MTNDTQNLTVETLGSLAALEPILRALEEARDANRSLCLDLSPLDQHGAEHRRFDLTAALILSNLLLGSFGRLGLDVRWPTSLAINLPLERACLPFALAQRRGKTTFINDHPRKWNEWKKNWRPSTESLWEDLEATEIQRRTYAYINTHRLGRNHFRGYHEGAALPWLRKLVPVPKDVTARTHRVAFVSLAERAVVELNENVSAHAFDIKGNIENRDEWLLPAEVDGASLVTCSLTKGGTNSWNRLYLLAMDNGYGIGRTLRWQHPGLAISVEDLVERILRKQLHARGIQGHNGIGLWWLNDLACTVGGEIQVITEDDLDRTGKGCVIVTLKFDVGDVGDGGDRYSQDVSQREAEVTVERLDMPMRGTIVRSRLHVPRQPEDMWIRPLADDRELVH